MSLRLLVLLFHFYCYTVKPGLAATFDQVIYMSNINCYVLYLLRHAYYYYLENKMKIKIKSTEADIGVPQSNTIQYSLLIRKSTNGHVYQLCS